MHTMSHGIRDHLAIAVGGPKDPPTAPPAIPPIIIDPFNRHIPLPTGDPRPTPPGPPIVPPPGPDWRFPRIVPA